MKLTLTEIVDFSIKSLSNCPNIAGIFVKDKRKTKFNLPNFQRFSKSYKGEKYFFHKYQSLKS